MTLPVWADTYDFAHRGEMLGVGRWGSRTAAPGYTTNELGPVLVDVVLGPRSEWMRQLAQEWARTCAEKGEGRDIAAEALVAELRALES